MFLLFGYVTPLKAELKVKDFTKFRSYYCGLCFQLKNSAGNIPRIVLNYDMTFLAILLDIILLLVFFPIWIILAPASRTCPSLANAIETEFPLA